MADESLKSKESERKFGAGFGIPTTDDFETNLPPSTETSNQPSRTPNVTREGGGGFGLPEDQIVQKDANTKIFGVDENGEYPFQTKKKKLKNETIEKEYEAIALKSTFLTGLQKIYLSGLVFLAAFLSFYIITQTTNFIVQLKDCPPLFKYPLYVAICFLAVVILFFIYKLVRSWLTLKQSPQISLGTLATLSNRRDLQLKCYKKTDEACNDLYDVIHGINEEEYNKSLKSMHFTEDEIRELSDSRKMLCKRHEARKAEKGRESSNEWIDSFAKIYQAKLDYLANERIKFYSYHGGIAATISHVPTMDRFIVLSAMFGLVKDLLEIYNIRPSRINTSILLSKVIINTFCAGYVQEGAEAYSDVVNKALEAFKITFKSIPIVKDFFQESVTLGIEATAHAFIINRVGVAAQKMLVPIVKEK